MRAKSAAALIGILLLFQSAALAAVGDTNELGLFILKELSTEQTSSPSWTNRVLEAARHLLVQPPLAKGPGLPPGATLRASIDGLAAEIIPSAFAELTDDQANPRVPIHFANAVATGDALTWINTYWLARSVQMHWPTKSLLGMENVKIRIDAERKNAVGAFQGTPFERDPVFLANYANALSKYSPVEKPHSDSGHINCVALAPGASNVSCCTAFLIGPRLALSAAHCWYESSNCIRTVIIGTESVTGRAVNIKGPVMLHEGFKKITVDNYVTYTNDLMLIELAEDSGIKPMRLATNQANLNLNCGWLVGYGKINAGDGLPIGLGRRWFGGPVAFGDPNILAYGALPNTELVAGPGAYAADPCKGDSGAPLLVRDAEGQEWVFGVVSRGVKFTDLECGRGTIYVRVDQYWDWIQKKSAERNLALGSINR